MRAPIFVSPRGQPTWGRPAAETRRAAPRSTDRVLSVGFTPVDSDMSESWGMIWLRNIMTVGQTVPPRRVRLTRAKGRRHCTHSLRQALFGYNECTRIGVSREECVQCPAEPSPTDQGGDQQPRTASAAACPRPAASRYQRGCPTTGPPPLETSLSVDPGRVSQIGRQRKSGNRPWSPSEVGIGGSHTPRVPRHQGPPEAVTLAVIACYAVGDICSDRRASRWPSVSSST